METTKDIRDFTKEDTARARVLAALVTRLGKWVPAADLTHPDVGGSEGLRRLRELRAAGCQIEQDLAGEDTTMRKYKLIRIPDGDVLTQEKRPPRPTMREVRTALDQILDLYRDGVDADGKTKWRPVPDETRRLMTWVRWYFREKKTA